MVTESLTIAADGSVEVTRTAAGKRLSSESANARDIDDVAVAYASASGGGGDGGDGSEGSGGSGGGGSGKRPDRLEITVGVRTVVVGEGLSPPELRFLRTLLLRGRGRIGAGGAENGSGTLFLPERD